MLFLVTIFEETLSLICYYGSEMLRTGYLSCRTFMNYILVNTNNPNTTFSSNILPPWEYRCEFWPFISTFSAVRNKSWWAFWESNMINISDILWSLTIRQFTRTPIIQEAENRSVETSGMNVKKVEIKLTTFIFILLQYSSHWQDVSVVWIQAVTCF